MFVHGRRYTNERRSKNSTQEHEEFTNILVKISQDRENNGAMQSYTNEEKLC